MQKNNIFFYQQTDSTNIRAWKLAEHGAEHGTVVWALDQGSGRGRLGKKWESTCGKGLYLSFVLRPDVDFADYAKITLVAGVAVARFLKEELSDAATELMVKWPNDLFVAGKKIAGILAEAAAPGGRNRPYVILGIGVNALHERDDFPQDLCTPATSLFLETGRKYTLQPLVRNLQEHLLKAVSSFEKGQFAQLLTEWRSMDYLYGKKIECVSACGEVVYGVALGVDDAGVLHLQDSKGRIHEVLSGDLRLAGRTENAYNNNYRMEIL